MPETTAMSFYLIIYYLFVKKNLKTNFKNELFMFFFLAIAPLIKPSAGIIFFPIFLDYMRKIKLKYFFQRSIPFLICALPFCLWLYYGYLVNGSELSTGEDWSWNDVLFGRGLPIEYWTSFNFYIKI